MFYWLAELDGIPLAVTFAGNRLKWFFSHAELDNNHLEAHDTIRVRDALEVEEGSQPREMEIGEELDEGLRTGDVADEED